MMRAALGAAAVLFSMMASGQSFAEDRALKLYNLHTRERATVVFKRNGVYDKAGLDTLNKFLRDWRKNEPTKMDPHLFDLLWDVYNKSGSRDYINVICGYRSPVTNGMLRRRSSGVAKNSQHTRGKAMDFFLPDVPLAKLRAIGLQMQVGGVGFYPTSGSPFVHMDTGSVRHWPRMTRQQLVKVFPNGNTLHVPSDGKPLPGYAQALAAYNARKSGMTATTRVASFSGSPVLNNDAPKAVGKPIVIAAADDEDEDAADVAAEAPKGRVAGVAVASYATAPVPVPRLAPRPSAPPPVPPVVLASAMPEPVGLRAPGAPDSIGTLTRALSPDFDFGGPQDWSQPAVPAALAAAMAERDQTRRGASLPIPPTSVVATIDVSRPLRADAITSAVLRRSGNTGNDSVPTLMAYAPANIAPEPAAPATYASAAGSIPMPRVSPVHRAAAGSPLNRPAPVAVARTMPAPHLTMTALDTQGLRMWIGSTSTRQKAYAVLTMPDFGGTTGTDLMAKPEIALAAGFGLRPYDELRTDRFTGALVAQPAVVDLRYDAFVASTR